MNKHTIPKPPTRAVRLTAPHVGDMEPKKHREPRYDVRYYRRHRKVMRGILTRSSLATRSETGSALRHERSAEQLAAGPRRCYADGEDLISDYIKTREELERRAVPERVQAEMGVLRAIQKRCENYARHCRLKIVKLGGDAAARTETDAEYMDRMRALAEQDDDFAVRRRARARDKMRRENT